jgi:hypothetical protein
LKIIFAVLAVSWVAYYLRLGIGVIERGGFIDVGFLVGRLAVAVVVAALGYVFFLLFVPWITERFRNTR